MTTRLSPPRPADLSSIVQRIEERRHAASQGATYGGVGATSSVTAVTFASPSPLLPPSVGDTPSMTLRRGATSPGRSPSAIPGLGISDTHTSSSSFAAAAPTSASHSTEVSLLRLDLHQRLAELDLKKKTILKLEGDNLRLLHELDSNRSSDAERRDALVRAHREELSRERHINEELQQKLLAEVASRGQAERAALANKDLKTKVDALEEQLRQKEAALADRERALDDALHQKRSAESQLREYESADVSNVLRGRLAVVEERLGAAQQQLHDFQSALTLEERRRKDTEGGLAEALRTAEAKTVQYTEVSSQVFELEGTITRLRSDGERQAQKIEAFHAQQVAREEEHTKELLSLQQQVDEGRAETRKRMHQIFQLETHVAELQEQQRTAADAHTNVTESVRLLQGELAAVTERLRQSHSSVEEREAELSKMHVVSLEHKNTIASLKAQCQTLQRDLEATATQARDAREEVGEMTLLLAQRATAEERLTMSRKAHAALERELVDEQRTVASLRDRVAVLEQQVESSHQQSTKLLELQRILAAREEDVATLQSDAKVWALKEAALREDVAAARERCHVADTKYQVEVERRDEVERKLRVLEEAHQSNLGIYGKYAALQQYLSTASSEASKSLELNNALLEEVKALEVANRSVQRLLDHALEERSVFAAQAAESVAYKSDMERALARAREAESREHELLVVRRNDPLHRRVQELEGLMVDAVHRATAAEAQLSQLQQLQRSPLRVVEDVQRATTASRGVSPVAPRISPPRPQQQQDDVSSESSVDEPPVVPLEHADTAPAPPAPLATLNIINAADHADPALVEHIQQQQERLVSQDRRLELLSTQFAEALAELKELKEQDVNGGGRGPSPGRSLSRATDASLELSPASTTTTTTMNSIWGSGASVDLRRALQAAQSDIHRARLRQEMAATHATSTSLFASPLALAQSQQQQRRRGDESRHWGAITDARTPTPPRSGHAGRPSGRSNRSSPLSPDNGVRGNLRSPRGNDQSTSSLQHLGTPPRAPSPKTARIREQRAALSDNVRERMSRLFLNASSLATPSPVRTATTTNAPHFRGSTSPPAQRGGFPSSHDAATQRRLTGVMSPAR